MFSGTNLPKVGSYNINVVISAIQSSDGTSRVEVAKQTGLTAQTVSVIVRRLIKEGIVQESGSVPSTGGKPRKTLRINPTSAYAVGINFDPLGVSIVVVDMMGQTLARSSPEISPDQKSRKTLRINPTSAYAVGINFDPLGVSIVVVEMMGQTLARSSQEISPGFDPEALI